MDSESPSLAVAADHPALPGHFPGRPIVPGVVLLDLLVETWRAKRPDAPPLRGLRKMKFIRMLAPGEPIRVDWGPIRDGKASFSVHANDAPVASGQFVLD